MPSADPRHLLEHEFPPTTFTYTERDAILYALGVGMHASDGAPERLAYLYERAPGGLKTLPTYPAALGFDFLQRMESLPGFEFEWVNLLHGTHRLELFAPLPPNGTLTNRAVIAEVWDKGSGTVLNVDVDTTGAEGSLFARNRYGLFVRGLGGYGGERGPKAESRTAPPRAPDRLIEERTLPQQAALYRLSGDPNPLHIDAALVRRGGLEKPILHGLCTLGFAARAALETLCEFDASRFKAVSARFTAPVWPGETLRTELWREPNGIHLRVSVTERDAGVIDQGWIELHP
ncbi:MAG: MaoC family dehydratase N-terminal domain-containing protein [Chloroflexi bacterium]|nr:MaoC family dehydratase N-terminal domain-containing protein [Chloroflexota bacterium]